MTANWSLRGRLFLLIVPPLVAVAAIAGVVRYVMAERMSERLYDNTLLAVALTISRDVVLSEGDMLADQLLEELTKSLGDRVYYRISGPDRRFVTGYSDAPELPEGVGEVGDVPLFYDSTALGQPVRVVALQEDIPEPQFGGRVKVEVWQTVNQRDALSLQLLSQSAMLMALVIASAALLVWFGINRGLSPLLELRDAIELRSPEDLGPVRRPVPRELVAIVAAMNSLFGRLSEAFAQRDSFISDAAHQLRNPVAAIQAQAEAATTAPDEPELRSRVSELAKTARRTGRLTQQLLSMEKVRGRGPVSSRSSTNLQDLVADHTRRCAETAIRSGAAVSFETIGEPKPAQVDAVMIGEALDNLLDNALRYGCGDEGEINVTLAFEWQTCKITVADNGPGIRRDSLHRVFDRFYRINDDTTGGCGLGLSIVQRVAEAHGGNARVVGTKNGTTVEMSFLLQGTAG